MFLSWNEDGEAKKIIYLGSTGQVRDIVQSSRQESAASDSARGQEGGSHPGTNEDQKGEVLRYAIGGGYKVYEWIEGDNRSVVNSGKRHHVQAIFGNFCTF